MAQSYPAVAVFARRGSGNSASVVESKVRPRRSLGLRTGLAEAAVRMSDWLSSESEVVRCTHCGQKNRMRSGLRAPVICGNCGVALVGKPWAGTLPKLVGSLLHRYRGGFAGAPSWAYPLPPPVPFVGRAYE